MSKRVSVVRIEGDGVKSPIVRTTVIASASQPDAEKSRNELQRDSLRRCFTMADVRFGLGPEVLTQAAHA